MIPTGHLSHSVLLDETLLLKLGCDEEPPEVQRFTLALRALLEVWQTR